MPEDNIPTCWFCNGTGTMHQLFKDGKVIATTTAGTPDLEGCEWKPVPCDVCRGGTIKEPWK